MEISLWFDILLKIASIIFVLVFFGLFLKIQEAKGWVPASLVAISGMIVLVLGIGFFSGSQVIEIDGENQKNTTWIVKFKDGENIHKIQTGKTYVYNAGTEACSLTLYPIYYTAFKDKIDQPVNNPQDAICRTLEPGEIWMLNPTPIYWFRSPEHHSSNYKSETIVWCIDRTENVDNGIPVYRRLIDDAYIPPVD